MFIQKCTHLGWSETVHGNGTLVKTWIKRYTQIMPSTLASGRAGTLLPSKAALPRWRSTPSLPHKWEIASPSSCPVCLAKADPSFLTSLSATLCQPPKVSAASGKKAIPWARHSSSAPLTLFPKACSRANPGVVAAPGRKIEKYLYIAFFNFQPRGTLSEISAKNLLKMQE